MAVVLDTTNVADARQQTQRHPEKAHRPDTPLARKPDWIRVKAPVSEGYLETRAIVRAQRPRTPSARRPAAPISASAGRRSTRPS